MFKSAPLLLGILTCWICQDYSVTADIGDVLVESNYRNQIWKIHSEKGKEAGLFEENQRQVRISHLEAQKTIQTNFSWSSGIYRTEGYRECVMVL
jgi:hypothetical protein